MAEEDTESLELVPIEVWNSREALDVNIVNLEEEGQDRESSTNENSDGTGSAAAVSAAGNIADEKCVCYIQPWLMAALPLCAITVVLGGVSVFTNSWARLNDTHIGLFTTCSINVTSMASVCVEHGVAVCTRSTAEECYEARYGIHAAAALALTGFILSGFALLFILLAWFFWFFTFMSSAANFCTGVIYLVTVIVFSTVDLRLLNLPQLAVENYSFAICICSAVAAFLSGGFTLQALSWQLSKFDKRAMLNRLKGT